MKNKQLTVAQRSQIVVLLQTKTAINLIAELLETHRSTIYREINRNKGKNSYSVSYAQMLSDERKERFGRPRAFTNAMQVLIKAKMINKQWSPEQIIGETKTNNIPMVSCERIYQYIRLDKEQGGELWQHTRHKLKHRKRPVGGKKVIIKNKVSIEERPAIVDEKSRCGDWEMDTIIGKDGKGAILTMVERKTGYLIMEKLKYGKEAEPLSKVVVRRLFAYRDTVHTITSDNGTEFANHQFIAEKLKTDYYFAHPYSSWERGLNEYTNKLIRQYIIKGSNFDDYSDEYIQLIQNKLNKRPRKKLEFQTPSKIFFASLN